MDVNLSYATKTILLMTDLEEKLKLLLNKVVDESKKQRLNMSCMKTECIVVCKRENSS